MQNQLPKLLIASLLAASVPCLPSPAQGSLTTASDVSPSAPLIRTEDARIQHLLNRITFGPTPADMALVKKIGIENYIARQLNYQSVPESPAVEKLVASTELISAPPDELLAKYSRQVLLMRAKQQGLAEKTEINKEIQKTYKGAYQDMLEAKVTRNAESPRQLEEVMTEFWFNHFNISVNKGPMGRFLVASFEQQAIRPYALGKFRDLLEATEHHPAMSFYLDNWQNTDPNSPGARGRFKGINENYARELMELHTLGVDGGYTQQDVVALAHVLTGLGFPNPRQVQMGRVAVDRFGGSFDRSRHDFGDKMLLGHLIRGTGEQEVETALDILAKHPSTAKHISYQLAQYFVADKPPAALVDRLTGTYESTDGDIKAVMNTLLNSPEFWDGKYYNAKYKSPYRYAISVLRAGDVQLNNVKAVDAFLKQNGQPLYGCLTPDGYKNTKDAWLNSDGLLKRVSFAAMVARGRVGELPPDQDERLSAVLGAVSSNTAKALANTAGQDRVSLMLGSPEFQTY